MSDDLVFYTNPMSRGRIVRWMLEEIGCPYRTKLLEYGTTMKGADYLAINPMGKVPAIVHKGKVVTETAAICAYLADVYPEAGLAPSLDDRADYYRWMFYAAGPIEAAFANKAAGLEFPADKQGMAGYGNFELAISTLEKAVAGRTFIAGERFTAADVYVGSMANFLIGFGILEPRPALVAYVDGLKVRDAYKRAAAKDDALLPEPAPV